MIMTILVFIWLDIVLLYLCNYFVVSFFVAIIIPTVVLTFCIGLFYKIWVHLKKTITPSKPDFLNEKDTKNTYMKTVSNQDSLHFTEILKNQNILLDNIQESIIVIGYNGTIHFHNRQAEKLFNISNYSCIENAIQNVLPRYHLENVVQILSSVISGNSWQGEHEFIINNEKRFFMNRIDPVVYNDKSSGYVITSTDITELIRTKEKAEAANLAKSQFLANMSHEIRTPMIGILGAVELLEQDMATREQYDNISIIRECGEDLLSIINDILDVSKIEIGIIDLNPEDCSIYNIFSRTIAMIEPALKEKGLNLELDLNSISNIRLHLDHYKLRQILTNVLLNAIKFTNSGTIRLKAYIEYNELPNLIILVSDTGIGIPRHSLPYIFDPFSQVDNSASREYGGTGLGLYICKKLVDLMQGHIKVNSQLSKGTEFLINIPVKFPIPQSNTETNHDYLNISDDNTAFAPRSILVVEDHTVNQKIVCEMLKNYGFEVDTANNGLECLQILENHIYDMILLDMQMPIMDGYDTAYMVRKDVNLANIPIIAMTAHAMSGDREKCIASGCNSYIAKPFKAEELVAEINQHLNHPPAAKTAYYNNLFIQELIPDFIQQLNEHIKELHTYLSRQDISKIKSISHDIKGSAGLYGFIDLSKVAAEIEIAAQENNLTQARNLYNKLRHLYKETVQQVS